MRRISVFLFHGFLGLPSDWNRVEASLEMQLSDRDIECRIHKIGLWDKWSDLQAQVRPAGARLFEAWSEATLEMVARDSEEKIFLGYSLGGRLLMHLPLGPENRVLLCGYISAHPGLLDKSDREARVQSDKEWAHRFRELEWASLMTMWDAQGVFSKDGNRPQREESEFSRQILASAIVDLSLGAQDSLDRFLESKNVSQKWIVGADDSKFRTLGARMASSFGLENCVTVTGGGHGLLWDCPEAIARLAVEAIDQKEVR